jgi:hypothetical protein
MLRPLKSEVVLMYKLRGYLKETKKVHDIADYSVKGGDLDLTLSTGKEYRLDDFEYLIIPVAEFRNIIGAMPNTKEKSKRDIKIERENAVVETAVSDIVNGGE